MKTDFFQKLFFSTFTKELKSNFFEILIIFKKLSEYVKTGFFFFFSEKSDLLPKKIANTPLVFSWASSTPTYWAILPRASICHLIT